MIIDKLENISKYSDIPSNIVEFVNNLSKDINLGRVQLNESDYANVEMYETKFSQDAKFEAHKKYIDIQILLDGSERIYYTSLQGLNECEPYNEVRDIVFYKNAIINADYVTLDGTNFAMIFPHEAHAPQVCVGEKSNVKKVVG